MHVGCARSVLAMMSQSTWRLFHQIVTELLAFYPCYFPCHLILSTHWATVILVFRWRDWGSESPTCTQTIGRKAETECRSSRCQVTCSILAAHAPPFHSSYLFHTAALVMFQNLSKLSRWPAMAQKRETVYPMLHDKLAADPPNPWPLYRRSRYPISFHKATDLWAKGPDQLALKRLLVGVDPAQRSLLAAGWGRGKDVSLVAENLGSNPVLTLTLLCDLGQVT